ncbi:MAG: hypothetical protein FWE21_05625 [Defluviitaleaceae bacterium]|nr:hypothetical protein [Defluviitaleaceae bacterium]
MLTRYPPKAYLTNTLAPTKTTLEQNEQISLFDFSVAIAEEDYNADTWKGRRLLRLLLVIRRIWLVQQRLLI